MNKDKFIIVRVDTETRSRIEKLAEHWGVSISEAIRRLMENVPVKGKIEDGKVFIKE